MDDEFLVMTLKRIFDECQEAQNRGDAREVGKALVLEFNDLLENYKSAYPDNNVIQSVQPAELNDFGNSAKESDVQQVKQNCLKIADALEIDTDDFREPSTGESFQTIHFEANQEVQQSVSVENIIEMVNMPMMPDDEKEELQTLIEEFDKEVKSGEPDKTKLERLLNSVREKKPDIALQLGALALQNGVDVLLGAV